MASSSDNSFLTRRRFLQFGLMASALGVTWSVPLDVLAAQAQARNTLPLPARKPRPPRLLMIDPGHGGRDPGAIGLTGTQEKDVTLDIARRMADAVSAYPGMSVKLTRETDDFLPLQDRVKIGRQAQADMFISIHADSAPNSGARGLSVYTLSEKASDDFSRELAAHSTKAVETRSPSRSMK